MTTEHKYDGIARELTFALRHTIEAWEANNARLRQQIGLRASVDEFRRELGAVRAALQRGRDAVAQLRSIAGEMAETEHALDTEAIGEFQKQRTPIPGEVAPDDIDTLPPTG